MRAAARVGDAAEIYDGIEEVAEDDEVAGDRVGCFSGDDVELEGGRLGIGKEADREKTFRQRGGGGENGVTGRHVVLERGHWQITRAGAHERFRYVSPEVTGRRHYGQRMGSGDAAKE